MSLRSRGSVENKEGHRDGVQSRGRKPPWQEEKTREKRASSFRGTLQLGVGVRGAPIDTQNYKEVPFYPVPWYVGFNEEITLLACQLQ